MTPCSEPRPLAHRIQKQCLLAACGRSAVRTKNRVQPPIFVNRAAPARVRSRVGGASAIPLGLGHCETGPHPCGRGSVHENRLAVPIFRRTHLHHGLPSLFSPRPPVSPCRDAASSGREQRSSGTSGQRRGMTLIEVLVAVALMSMLSVGLFTALQIGATSWQTTRERLMLDRRVATANAILHSSLASIVPLLAEIPPERTIGLRQLLFFQGEPDSMRFVSAYSVTEGVRGGLRIVELRVSSAPNGLRILLNQLPYLGPLSAGSLVADRVSDPDFPRGRIIFSPIRALPTSLIIADELATCNFSYLRRSRRQGEPTAWLAYWGELDSLPAAIRVSLSPSSQEARVLPVSITTAVRAEWAPGGQGAAPPSRYVSPQRYR